jgi:hypothetical protein
LAAVVVGMVAAAAVRNGAYYPDVAVGVAGVSALVLLGGLWRGTDRRGWARSVAWPAGGGRDR